MPHDDPRYPIGPFREPTTVTPALRVEWIDAIAGVPAALRAAITGLGAAQLDTPYRDGGWTVRQVVHHLPDSHMNAYTRHKLATTEANPTIKPYDEVAWAALPDGSTGEPGPSLTLLTALHERWVRFLRALTPAQFARTFVHPAGPRTYTVDTSVALYAWHGRHHVAHITALRQRRGW